MCKAHILRFRCHHGILMGIEPCRLSPCPKITPTGTNLTPQPFKCYNCQHKDEENALRPTPSRTSTVSMDSLSSNGSDISTSPTSYSPLKVSHPLPNVAVQPRGSVCHTHKPSVNRKRFSFSCHSSDHFLTPHYAELPAYLPHQDHACPPCQLEGLRQQSDTRVTQMAKATYPNLRDEMLVRDGRAFDPEIMTRPTLAKYVDEIRAEDRQLWWSVTRKWTQDLKKARVLVAEEDGLGLWA